MKGVICMNNKETWIIQHNSWKFKNVCIASNLFNYLENCETARKSVLNIKYVSKVCTETHVGLQVNWP
jgi:hypothetical protein